MTGAFRIAMFITFAAVPTARIGGLTQRHAAPWPEPPDCTTANHNHPYPDPHPPEEAFASASACFPLRGAWELLASVHTQAQSAQGRGSDPTRSASCRAGRS